MLLRAPLAAVLALAAATAVAEPVAMFTSGTGTMTLHSETGHCLRGAKLATWEDAIGTIPGCWQAITVGGQPAIAVSFADADSYRLPLSAFRRPTRL